MTKPQAGFEVSDFEFGISFVIRHLNVVIWLPKATSHLGN